MNRMVDRSVPQGDDVDALLGAFFKAQMPRKWPPFQAPRRSPGGGLTPSRSPSPRPGFVLGSRFALAASVALLLVCGWLLAGRFPGTAAPGGQRYGDPNALRRRPHEQVPIPIPDPIPAEKPAPGKVKSKLSLEQGLDGRTGIRIDVEDLPSNR